jgi:hypothetical protein
VLVHLLRTLHDVHAPCLGITVPFPDFCSRNGGLASCWPLLPGNLVVSHSVTQVPGAALSEKHIYILPVPGPVNYKQCISAWRPDGSRTTTGQGQAGSCSPPCCVSRCSRFHGRGERSPSPPVNPPRVVGRCNRNAGPPGS